MPGDVDALRPPTLLRWRGRRWHSLRLSHHRGPIDRDRVYAWFPIEDNRVLKAYSPQDYVEEWLSGRLKV